MKKALTLATLFTASTLICVAPSQHVLERTITGIHTKLFGADNLYKTYLEAQEWDDVIASTEEFVKEHHDNVAQLHNKSLKRRVMQARSSTMIRNKELTRHFNAIKKSSEELVTSSQAAYIELFESGEPKNARIVERFNKKFDAIYTKMNELTKELKAEMDDLKNIIKAEDSDTKKAMLKEQEQVVTVLHRLSLTVALTARKAQNDLKK
jgi:hypothetical protein